MRRTILTLAMMLTAIVGMAKDIKTVVVTTTPQMHCENCENKIKGNMRFERGVKKITTDISNQTVTIEYDADKTNVEALLKGFAKFGYEARQLKEGETVEKNADEKCKNM